MGFFDKALGALAGIGGGSEAGSSISGDDAETATCPFCGSDKDADDISVDFGCEDCPEPYSGPKYCCGGIYEQGETVCASCGDPL